MNTPIALLPKTRSEKIMQTILHKIAEGDINNLGDMSTLLEPSVVEEIKKGRFRFLITNVFDFF